MISFLFFLIPGNHVLTVTRENASEKAMATHSSTLTWKIPWMEETGRLQSMGLLGVRQDWATSLFTFFTFHFHALEKEMATHSSVLAWRIPRTGEPGGLPSTGLHRVGHDWSDLVVGSTEEIINNGTFCLYDTTLFSSSGRFVGLLDLLKDPSVRNSAPWRASGETKNSKTWGPYSQESYGILDEAS